MTVKNIFAFIGRAGSGKGFECDKLTKDNGFIKMSFADTLREVMFKTLNLVDITDEEYTNLKSQKMINGLTLRNLLENQGSALRDLDKDIFPKSLIKKLDKLHKDSAVYSVCIDDMRYDNEYLLMYDYCTSNNINFSVTMKDFRSDRYEENNTHESARLSNFLVNNGYKDNENIPPYAVVSYKSFCYLTSNNKIK